MGRFFKFRSAMNPEFIFDILINNRLYCAPVKTLNDPTEGIFVYSSNSNDQKKAKRFSNSISSEIDKMRVCSLSRTYDSHLLWAHYATGFNGVAIEFDLDDQLGELHEINYGGVFGGWNYAHDLIPSETAHNVLLSKGREWSYEQESRIIQKNEWFYLNSAPRRLIAGHRIHTALFDALQVTSERLEIEFTTIGIGDEGLDIDSCSSFDDRIAGRVARNEMRRH